MCWRRLPVANSAAIETADEPCVVGDAPLADHPSVDVAWCVLEAANDLGDVATVEACRRVIDANLNGRLATWSDMKIIVDYFR
jgi:hypothetical protein